ncbi:acyl carrier protein [Lutispora saccharofermentans]|uniref:Acyl carrier protein n=1 Tax=Lutispora saccharofermentans TaxID=3024236 RepID=A0ABT1NIS1_9FIRM|nr:acyl carrier protein [Lutispora saccharofermentans]MCQ1531097.1 acyl carrier protein [Lutispora saccharofermentans]
MEVRPIICDIINSNTVIGDRIYNLDENENLLDQGIDSLQMMRVIVTLEQALKFEFRDEDLLMINFSNISSMESCIKTILANTNKID